MIAEYRRSVLRETISIGLWQGITWRCFSVDAQMTTICHRLLIQCVRFGS